MGACQLMFGGLSVNGGWVTPKSANFLRQKQVRKRGGGTPLGTKSAKQYLTGSQCNIVINREDPPILCYVIYRQYELIAIFSRALQVRKNNFQNTKMAMLTFSVLIDSFHTTPQNQSIFHFLATKRGNDFTLFPGGFFITFFVAKGGEMGVFLPKTLPNSYH